MDDRTITVFGGTGFLGSEVVRRLASSGIKVRIAARHPDTFDPGGLTPEPERVEADIRDASAVADAVAGAWGVVNAVSLYVERGDLDFNTIHVEGARSVARCAREQDVPRLVHVSGIGVDEASPSAFVRARARGESAVRETFDQAAVLRPSTMFGPDDAFLSSLERVTRLPVVPLFGAGKTRLQPAYVKDVAAAAAAVFERPETQGRVFELGGATVHTYRELVQAVSHHLDRNRLLLPMPFAIWKLVAAASGILENPPLTVDQVTLMQRDNVANPRAQGFRDLGIEPSDLLSMLDTCLPAERERGH
ncbi:complex I NDUFA9 subunit family protein [Marilutibacter alkalisoli]|uniref:Complex I NDUFA9 subunit family protein n=1 Tax=Marilutibacter alkalisoli TaxID=2591633 RepID=A0A514BSG6_9GAMM|nr:complex I NDUFA9 subunit family protein [Lysobacter alkalisoli]QDH70326.1 complex I NDUFA9 subunit family protein [Lysobacter alkalisoli]